MRILGELSLQAAFIAAGFSAFANLWSTRFESAALARIGVRAAWLCLSLLLAVVGVLVHALVLRDYDFEYVAHYTSSLLPWHFCVSALWVGQAGSLLLWATISAAIGVVFSWRPCNDKLRRTAFGLLMVNVAFLIAIMVFAADPMAPSLIERQEGNGFSPLLQHPSMLIHPPLVFLAYGLWSVPCALAAAALLTGVLKVDWVQQTRPWALSAWLVLGAGLLLGAHWAYQELGWGGYWGWDPVENGSLLPWLTGTAFVHACMVWKHRGGMKRSAVALAIGTFALCNFATFLTRSGIFSSVHAFSQSPLGWMFLGWMMVVLGVGGWGLFRRRASLATERPLGGLLSRESLILASTFLLMLLTTVVLVGTLFVPLSSLIAGRTMQIGAEFYNAVFGPIGVAVLGITSIVPLMRWGKSPNDGQRRTLKICTAISLVAAGATAAAGVRHPALLAVVALAALTILAAVGGWRLDAQRLRGAGRWTAWGAALGKHRPQYAGYLVHLGLAAIAIGIAGSSWGSQRVDVELDEGQEFLWAGYRIQHQRLVQREEPDRLIAEAVLHVSDSGGATATLQPARHLHTHANEWTTEVDVWSTWSGDFYTVLHAGLGEGRIQATLVHNPLIGWIWGGGWFIAGAVLLAAWPHRSRRSASSTRRVDSGGESSGESSGFGDGSGEMPARRRAA